MPSIIELQVTDRDDTLNPRQLRTAGFLPATLYGKNVEPRNLQVRTYDFTRALSKGSTTFKLQGASLDGFEVKLQNLQTESISQVPLNIEFMPLKPVEGNKEAKVSKKAAPAAVKKTSKKTEEAALASA